jgi:hypothetical protein
MAYASRYRTWEQFRDNEVRVFLADRSEGKYNWTDPELLLYLNWGLLDLAQYVPKKRKVTFESTVTSATLPTDFISPVIVEFPEKQFIEQTVITPGTGFYSKGVLSESSLPNTFTIEQDEIKLWREPDGTWYLHYLAYYQTIEEVSALVEVPQWAYRALTYFIAAQCISKDAVGEAQLDRWRRKTDAGKPTDNALAQEADRLYRTYHAIVLQHIGFEEPVIHIYRPRQRTR